MFLRYIVEHKLYVKNNPFEESLKDVCMNEEMSGGTKARRDEIQSAHVEMLVFSRRYMLFSM